MSFALNLFECIKKVFDSFSAVNCFHSNPGRLTFLQHDQAGLKLWKTLQLVKNKLVSRGNSRMKRTGLFVRPLRDLKIGFRIC